MGSARVAIGDVPPDGRWTLRGGRLLSAGRPPRVADLVLDEGRVVAVLPAGAEVDGPVLDVDGLDVAPGAIDLHVHLRDPGQTHKETVETGTAAAAAGGVTLACDMPNTDPPVASAHEYDEKQRSWTGRAVVDYALWAGGTDPAELRGMADLGAIGVKIYMATAPGFDSLFSPGREAVTRVLEASREIGWAVSVHVGDQEGADAERDALLASGRRDPAAVLEVVRGPGNLRGLQTALDAAVATGCRLHVAHVSAYGLGALDLFRAYRSGHPGLTAETCFPALSEEEDLPRLGVYALPTVFSADARRRVLEALADGDIDAIATDHAPHTRAEKDRGSDDAWQAPPGYPAVETSVPLTYDAMLSGTLSPQRFVDAVAGAPARILGLSDRGHLGTGVEANLMLLDPGATWSIDESTLHSRVGWSPFHGRTLRGRVVATYLRGSPVAHEGRVVGSPAGVFVRRAAR